MRIPNSEKLEEKVGAYNRSMRQLTDFLNDILSRQLAAKQCRAHRTIKVKRRFACTRFISYRKIRQTAFEVLGLDTAKYTPVVIHVTGSNGKGTTGFMLQNILRSFGYNAALYNKPHLVFPTERLLVDGWPVAPDEYLKSIKETIEVFKYHYPEQELWYLPLLFLAATRLVFTTYSVDFYIVEAGVGLKNDYTNIFREYPYYYVLVTDVDLMHQKRLGYTLQDVFDNKNANYKLARKTYLLFDPRVKGIEVPGSSKIIKVKPKSLAGIFNPYGMVVRNSVDFKLNASGVFKDTRESELIYKAGKSGEARAISNLPFIPIGLFSKKHLLYFSQLLEVFTDIIMDLKSHSELAKRLHTPLLVPITSRRYSLSDTHGKDSFVAFRIDTQADMLRTIGVNLDNDQTSSILKTKLLHIQIGNPPLSSYAFIPSLPGRFTPIGVSGRNMVIVDNAHSLAQYRALADVLKQFKASYPVRIRVVFASGKHSYRKKAHSIFSGVDEFVDVGILSWRDILKTQRSEEYRYEYRDKTSVLTEFDKKILQALGLDPNVTNSYANDKQKKQAERYTVTIVTGSVYFVGYVIELLLVRRGLAGFAPPGFGEGNVYSWIALYRTQNWISKIKQFLRFLNKSRRHEFIRQLRQVQVVDGSKDPKKQDYEALHKNDQQLAKLYNEYIKAVTHFYVALFNVLEVKRIGAFLPFKHELPLDLMLRRVIKNVPSITQVVIPVYAQGYGYIYERDFIFDGAPSLLDQDEEFGWRLLKISPKDYIFLSDVLRGKKKLSKPKDSVWRLYERQGGYAERLRAQDEHAYYSAQRIYEDLGIKQAVLANLGVYVPKYHRYFSILGFNDSSHVIFVPGFVFDLIGGRIGSGSGIYDKYLEGLKYTFVDLLTAPLNVQTLDRGDLDVYKDLDAFDSRVGGNGNMPKVVSDKSRFRKYLDSFQQAIDILTTINVDILADNLKELNAPIVIPVRYPFEQVVWVPGRYRGAGM